MAALRLLLGLSAGRRRKWLALGIWLFLIAGASAFAGRLSTVENNNATTWLPANAESTRALQVALDHFGAGQQTAAVIVFVRQGGLTVEDRAAVERDRVALAPRGRRRRPAGPVPGQKGAAANRAPEERPQ